MFLSENSTPAWLLVPQNIFKATHQNDLKITWIPTVENMLEDALLMIAIHVLKDTVILPLANEYFRVHQFYSQLPVIEKYKFDVEVCKTSFLRKYSV